MKYFTYVCVMTKYCKYCDKDKSVDDFHKHLGKKDGLADRCKECRKIYHRKHYLENKSRYLEKANVYDRKVKEWFLDIKKGLKCQNCEENRHWVLDFHHIDPNDKTEDMGRLCNTGSKRRILEEMKKCIVLCANCHRDLHYKNKLAE